MIFGGVKKIGIFAPAGKLAAERCREGCDFLAAAGIAPIIASELFVPADESYLAAPAEHRAAALQKLWLDPGVELLLAVRGGFGCAHLLELIDWDKLRRRREMPLVGYSDITALHWAMERFGAGRPVVAPMLGKLAEASRCAFTAEFMARAFRDELYEIPCPEEFGGEYHILHPGNASGFPLAGNLTVAASLAGTGYFPDVTGRIVIFEDVNEPLYRIDRELTVMRQCGVFSKCAGVLFGQFTGVNGSEDELLKLLTARTAEVRGPVVQNFAYGHTFPLAAVDMHRPMRIEFGRVFVR